MGEIIGLILPRDRHRDRVACWLRGHVWKLRENCDEEKYTLYVCERCRLRMLVEGGKTGVRVSYFRRVRKLKVPWTTKGWRYQLLRLRSWIKTSKAERELIRQIAMAVDREIIEALEEDKKTKGGRDET